MCFKILEYDLQIALKFIVIHLDGPCNVESHNEYILYHFITKFCYSFQFKKSQLNTFCIT